MTIVIFSLFSLLNNEWSLLERDVDQFTIVTSMSQLLCNQTKRIHETAIRVQTHLNFDQLD